MRLRWSVTQGDETEMETLRQGDETEMETLRQGDETEMESVILKWRV